MKKYLLTTIMIVGLFIIIISNIFVQPNAIKMVAIGDSITYGTVILKRKGILVVLRISLRNKVITN